MTHEGRACAERRAGELGSLGLVPSRCFSSQYEHARETARCFLSSHRSEDCLEELNPGTESGQALAAFADRLAGAANSSTIALVGHEPLLGQLVAACTGERIRPLGRLDAVCVSAPGCEDLRLGRGRIEWRYPVRAYEEARLRQKITTKMTSATFLAGFSFTALLAILLHDELRDAEPLVRAHGLAVSRGDLLLAASLFLVLAVVLFVGAVYVYDRLSMPEGFWGTSRAGRWRRMSCFSDVQRNEYGELYTHMVDAWAFFFTPVVVFAAAGFLLIAWAVAPPWITVGYALLLAVGTLYYRRLQPRLGVD